MTNIVIIGRGRRALVQQTIDSLYANTDQEQFNCVFVADMEEDFRILRCLRGITRKNFSLLEVTSGSSHVLSQLKNLGAYWSEQRWGRGDWLYFSDNDVWFSPGWMDKLTNAAELTEQDGFRLWGGQIHPFHQPLVGPQGSPLSWGEVDAANGNNVRRNATLTEHAILDGPSWLMRWNTWDTYGPLQRTTAPGVCQSEETPFCRLLTAPVSMTREQCRESELRGTTILGGCRIGVIHPHVVVHTGLSQSDGRPTPGAAERRALIPPGVLAE